MSQELTDAEWLRRAAVTLTLADKGYAPGHSLPEIVSALRSIADRLEWPGVEDDWTLEPPKEEGWWFFYPRTMGYGYPAELLKVNSDDEIGLTCWKPGMPQAERLDEWLAHYRDESLAFSTRPFNEPQKPLPWRKVSITPAAKH